MIEKTQFKESFEVPNLRQIKVKFISPTNSRGARVCIYEPRRYNYEQTQRKYFSYSYKYGDIMRQAFQTLKANGFNIVSRCSEYDSYTFLCDNWSDEFFEIKNLK